MLIAYLDESGSSDTPLVTMAGYLSDERGWRYFERRWAKILNEYGAEYLHMREFAHSIGEFKGWPEGKRRELLTKLASVIHASVKYRVGAAVTCADYVETVGAVDLRDNRRTPFWCCFISSISAILAYCKKWGITDDIALVFDENSESSQNALGFYSSFKELPQAENAQQLVSLSFADDQELAPLQAADWLAYELNKYHLGFNRKSLAVLEGTPGVFATWTRKMLEDYAASMRKIEQGEVQHEA